MQQQLFEHFSEEGHRSIFEDVSITSIDKIDQSNPLQREQYWRITLSFTLTTGFIRIVIKTWFTDTILEPIIIVNTFMTIIVVVVFINLLFLFFLSPWLCWWSSCHSSYMNNYIWIYRCTHVTTSSKVSIKTNAVTDEDNGRNESWHWTNDEIRIAIVDYECKSWPDSSVG